MQNCFQFLKLGKFNQMQRNVHFWLGKICQFRLETLSVLFEALLSSMDGVQMTFVLLCSEQTILLVCSFCYVVFMLYVVFVSYFFLVADDFYFLPCVSSIEKVLSWSEYTVLKSYLKHILDPKTTVAFGETFFSLTELMGLNRKLTGEMSKIRLYAKTSISRDKWVL